MTKTNDTTRTCAAHRTVLTKAEFRWFVGLIIAAMYAVVHYLAGNWASAWEVGALEQRVQDSASRQQEIRTDIRDLRKDVKEVDKRQQVRFEKLRDLIQKRTP